MSASVIPWELIIEVAKCDYGAWLGLRQCNRRLRATLDMSAFIALFTRREYINDTYYDFISWQLPDGKIYKHLRIVNDYNSSYDVYHYIMGKMHKKCHWIKSIWHHGSDMVIKIHEDRYHDNMRTTIKLTHNIALKNE